MKLFSHKKRPVHLGPYPLEKLARITDPEGRPIGLNGSLPDRPTEGVIAGPLSVKHAFGLYAELFDSQVHGEVSPVAPIPDDRVERANNLKAGCYFLDADMAATAVIPEEAWLDRPLAHRYALVILVRFSREMRGSQPGDAWIDGTRQPNADLRAAELAVIAAATYATWGSTPPHTHPPRLASISTASHCKLGWSRFVGECCGRRS